VQAKGAELMTILELPPLGEYRQRHAPPPAVLGVDEPAQPAPVETSQGGLLQFQLKRLINEILADQDLDPEMYVSLIGHLAENPGHPELALLAHLRDVQKPDDLPPYKAHRKPGIPPAETQRRGSDQAPSNGGLRLGPGMRASPPPSPASA
jgi:hypothetical protein